MNNSLFYIQFLPLLTIKVYFISNLHILSCSNFFVLKFGHTTPINYKHHQKNIIFLYRIKSGRGDRSIRSSHTTVRAVPRRSQLITHILLALEQIHTYPTQFIQRVIRQRFVDIQVEVRNGLCSLPPRPPA